MSGGGYRERSFGQHGAHYNNSSRSSSRRNDGRNERERDRDRDRERGRGNNNNNRHNNRSNYTHDNSTSSSRRDGRSQNDNWQSTRRFSRWDQPSQSSSSSIPTSSITNQQQQLPSPWAHNPPYQNGQIGFHYDLAQPYYNRNNNYDYNLRGGYRYQNHKGPQNFMSPYYSAPFRENIYYQHEKEVPPPEEPPPPLLGSEEERQLKISEAADDLKRKLMSKSKTVDNNEINNWDDDDTFTKSVTNNEANIIEPIPELKHGPPELQLTPNDLKDIGKLNDKDTIDPIHTIDCIQTDKSNELIRTTPVFDSIQDSVNINKNLVIVTLSDEVVTSDSNKNDYVIGDEQIIETINTVNSMDNLDNLIVSNDTGSFNQSNENSYSMRETIVNDNLIVSNESVKVIIPDEISSIMSTVVDEFNNIEVTNTEVPDLPLTNPSIQQTNNINNNETINAINIPSDNDGQDQSFTLDPTVQVLQENEELNLIQFLGQIAMSTNKSPSLTNEIITTNKITETIDERINDQVIGDRPFYTLPLTNNIDDDTSRCSNKLPMVISNDYSNSDILQPPPIPPSLPTPSYNPTELCLDSITPEFNSSEISNSCTTFHHSQTFDNNIHVLPTTSVINPPVNMSTSIPNYGINHQSYVPIVPFAPVVSLTYPTLDYISTQAVSLPPPPPPPDSPPIHSLILQDVCASNINEDDDVLDELKEAMKFASQCMKMGNDDDDDDDDDDDGGGGGGGGEVDEEAISFPTFPDLPPMMPETVSPEKPESIKKNSKVRKFTRGMLASHLGAIAKTKDKFKSINTGEKIETITIPNDNTAEDILRRKVVFNLNSKSKLLNKNDGVWMNVTENEIDSQQKKWKPLSPSWDDKSLENSEKLMRDNQTEKIREERSKESKKSREPERNRESGRSKEHEKSRETERNREHDRSRESEKNREYERSRDSERNKERERPRDSERNKERDKSRESERNREHEKSRESERNKDSEKSRESEKNKISEKSRESERNKDLEKSKESEKNKTSEKSRESERNKDSEKSKESERNTDFEKPKESGKSKDYEKIKEPEKTKGSERSRESEKKGVEKIKEPEKSKGTDKTKEPEKTKGPERVRESDKEKESEKIQETKKIKEPERSRGPENPKESEKNKGSGATKDFKNTKKSENSQEPKKNKGIEKISDDQTEFNKNDNLRRILDANRLQDKDPTEAKKKNEKHRESSPSSHTTTKKNPSTPTSVQKPIKIENDDVIIISDTITPPKVQLVPTNKLLAKPTAPTVKETSWKDRVIGRFLKMSKNDIQNMINNSSLRKFDIAMQQLVKEKKSSLSLEMRNHEDEKMKTSTYDNEDFLSQLQAILNPAATVDITNLPTNFIHQLSEVLHLDSLPVESMSNITDNETNILPNVQCIQEPSTSFVIDPEITSEPTQYIQTNTPVLSIHDISKVRKIDNRAGKDTVKNIPGAVNKTAATCIQTKVKRGQVNKAKIQRKKKKVTPLLPVLPQLDNDNQTNTNDHVNLIASDLPQSKHQNHTTLNINTQTTTTAPQRINSTPVVVIERIQSVNNTTPVRPRIETPIVNRVPQKTVEPDKLLTTGISKSKSLLAVIKTDTVDLTIDESGHDNRVNKATQHEMIYSETDENMRRRNEIGNANAYRNLTQDEYEAQHSRTPPLMSYEEEYRKLAAARSQKIPTNGRRVIAHTGTFDKTKLIGHQSPENIIIQKDASTSSNSDSQYDSNTSSTSDSNSNSDDEPSLIEVTKVLKFIKEREKMAKKKSINEVIRDEVAAEIEKRRREKNSKHKSHKSRSKKRDKKKKEKKVKKKKLKKKRRHKTIHHSSSSHVNENPVEEKNELPLRLLADCQIKREPTVAEPPKTVQEILRTSAESRRSIPATKIPVEVVTAALSNKPVGNKTVTVPQIPPIAPTMLIAPAVTTVPTTASTFKTNLMLNAPLLTVTVMNTTAANTSASATSVVKNSSTSTTTSPLRTVTVSGSTPQSPILHQKTKAQLKQMPEVIKTIQGSTSNITETKVIEQKKIQPKIIEEKILEPKIFVKKIIDDKILEPKLSVKKILEEKIVEPVSSTSENQKINFEPVILSSLPNTTSISTTAVTTTQSGPRKLNIKTYQERALQRKLKEEERMKFLVANPSQLTQNLLVLPAKNKPTTMDNVTSNCTDHAKIMTINTAVSITNQPNSIGSTSVDTEKTVSLTKIPDRIELKNPDDLSEKINTHQLSSANLSRAVAIINKDTNVMKNCIKTGDSKFINIKSEGGKELKLREKVKKRPRKILTSKAKSISAHNSPEKIKKLTSPPQNRQKKSPTQTGNIKVAIGNSLSLVNNPANDAKDNYYKDNNPSENIETDVANVEQKEEATLKSNEPSLNDVIISDVKLSPVDDSIKNTELIKDDQTSGNQSESIEKTLSIPEDQDEISIFSHYFKFTKGLISDDLPDTVPQERMVLQVTSQVPVIIDDDDKTSVVNSHSILSESKSQDENEIEIKIEATKNIPEVNVALTTTEETEEISTNNENLDKNPQENSDNLSEVPVDPILNTLEDCPANKIQSPASLAIVSNENIHSELSDTVLMTDINSAVTNTSVYNGTTTELMDSIASLSNIDSTISSTYDIFNVECDKIQNYDPLTLDELSDISMDRSSSPCNQKELSHETITDTDLLSTPQNRMEIADLLTNDELLIAEKKEDGQVSPHDKIDDWKNENINKNNLITQDTNKDQPPVEVSISGKVSPPNDCKESEQPIVIDRVLAMDEPNDKFIDDPITFSNIKSSTPEPTEFNPLNDNDVSESIHENSEVKETSGVNDLVDAVSMSNVLINDDEESDKCSLKLNTSPPATNALPQVSVDNSRPESPEKLPSDDIPQDSPTPSKELIKAVEELPELPSPILQTPEEPEENENNEIIKTNTDKVSETEKNPDQPDDEEPIDNDDLISNKAVEEDDEVILNKTASKDEEVIVDNVDDSNADKSLEYSSQRVMESPTSTTRIIETNSSGRDDSERSSSEARSVELDRTKRKMSFNSNTSQVKSQHASRSTDDTSRKSNGKSSILSLSHKKHKRHNHDRKKHKFTLEHVEEAISAKIVDLIPDPTTKGGVISRMQEIDITIQQLMNEKMRLYQMLQTDKWPVNQSGETLSETSEPKTKSQLPSVKINRQLTKESRVVASRLSDNGNVNKRSTTMSTEISTTKSQTSSTPKNENSKNSKAVVKSNDKRSKNLEEKMTQITKKRKHHHEQKESRKSKKSKGDELSVVKKRSCGESSRQKNKSPMEIKNSDRQRKPMKLSQLLAREFKPKVSITKRSSESPVDDDDVPKSHSENEEKVEKSSTTIVTKTSAVDESSTEMDSSDCLQKNTPQHDEHHKLIYSDESSWDDGDKYEDKHNQSTGLSLLEQSIKREMAAKKNKPTEFNEKTSKSSLDVSTSSTDLDIDLISKPTSNKKQQSKKLQQNTSSKTLTKPTNHVLEIIDAVVKNCTNDLNIKDRSPEKKQKTPKKNEKLEVNEHDSKAENKTKMRVESPVEKIKTQNETMKDIEEVELSMPVARVTPSISPRPISRNANEDNSNIHDEDSRKTPDSASDVSEKNESESIQHNESEKDTTATEVKQSSVDAHSEEKTKSTFPVVEQHEDAQNDNNVAISENKEANNDENTHGDKIDARKIIMEDWQDSPVLSDQESAPSHETKNPETAEEKESDKATPLPTDEPIPLDNQKLKPDSTAEKSLIKDSDDKSPLDERDDKSKRSNSVGKESESSKPSVKEMDRSKSIKRRRQSSSGRSSKQSNDSSNSTSRSRSNSKRTTKSSSSCERSTPDLDQRTRPNSGNSSSSVSSRRRSSSNSNTKTLDKNNSARRGRKRKNPEERTREQMMNCKVRLIDCKYLCTRTDLRSDILQRLGISRINAWTPSLNQEEPTVEQSTSQVPAIINEEDKNRSDDDSMEIIQVDEGLEVHNITSPESIVDVIKDPLLITPQASPEYDPPPPEDSTPVVDIEDDDNSNKDDTATSDDIQVLTIDTSTPVNCPSTSGTNDETDLQTLQYTVHKGPILDIKVFGDSFLAASEDGTIYRYCQRSNGILNIYKGHDAAVTCLYVHEVPGTADSGNTRWNLFSGSLDATLRCYDIVNGSLERHIADVGSPIQCMDQAWGMIFVGTKSGHISRYDIKSGCLREDNLDFSDKPVLALRTSTEGARRVLIVASRNQPITIRDAHNGLYLRTISGQRTHTVYSLLRDRNLVYCGTSSTSIPVFDFISGEQVLQYTAGVGIVCMRLYRQLLFAGCYDGNIYIFDTKNTKLVCSIPGPGNMLLSMEIVDDRIIAGSKDRRLHAWKMPSQARTILAERE